MKMHQTTIEDKTSSRKPSRKTAPIKDLVRMMQAVRTTIRKPAGPSRIKEPAAVAHSTVAEADSAQATTTAVGEVQATGTRETNTTRETASTTATEIVLPLEVAAAVIIKAGAVDLAADAAATPAAEATRSKANPPTTTTETAIEGTNSITARMTATSQLRANTRSTQGVVEEVQGAPWEAGAVTKARRAAGTREATRTTTRNPSTSTEVRATPVEAAAVGRAPTTQALESTQ